jgi:hypothetical protein
VRWIPPSPLVAALLTLGPSTLHAQAPVASEVRQIVTFSLLPGAASEVIDLYRSEALPLYEADDAMLSLRVFREVESPVPLDLIVVRGFKGMASMDRSNEALRALAERAGTSMGAIYGRMSALSTGHTDQFVEMLPQLGAGDPSSTRLTALVWYQVIPGGHRTFEGGIEASVAPWEASAGIPSATGRFLVSDGWHYFRLLGFDSLGAYQRYWSEVEERAGYSRLIELTAARREVIVASIPELSIR